MIWVRKFGVFWLAIFLLISVLVTATAISVVISVNRPSSIKTWVKKSGVYDHVLVAVLNNTDEQGDTTSSLSIQDPQVQTAIQESITPQVVQNGVETIIDSNFAWLNGKTDKPDFSVDLSQQKNDFANNVENRVKSFLTNLPACTQQQTIALQGQLNIKLFNLPCRPANINPTAEAARAKEQVMNADFLNDPIITASTLGDSSKKAYYVQYSNAPSIYRESRFAPLVLLAITVLLSFIVVIASTTRQKGKKNVAITLFVAAFLLVVGKVIIEAARYSQKVTWINVDFSKDLNKPLNDFVYISLSGITNINIIITVILIIIGILLIRSAKKSGVVAPKNRSKQTPELEAMPETNPIFFEEDGAPQPVAAPTPKPRPAAKPQPKKPRKPRLIQ